MQTITEIVLERAAHAVFTRAEVGYRVAAGGARLDALLKRAVAADEILRVRRSLFCLADKCRRMTPSICSSWPKARRDVERFVKPVEIPSLELWTAEFFIAQCRKIST